jgi:hypothetical protein
MGKRGRPAALHACGTAAVLTVNAERPSGPGVRTSRPDATHTLTRRDVVDLFQPQERAVLLQSTALKQVHRPIASLVGLAAARRRGAEQLGSASVQLFETVGLIGARTARPFIRWRRPGPMAMTSSRCWGHSPLQPPIPAETPFNATGIAHCVGDMLADALVERGLPRHQLESDSSG